jgi:hypothetical protein
MSRMTDEEFNNRQTTLLVDIPKEFHGALSYHAWESGHAYGYEEVLSHLQDLVEMIRKPINDFKGRILTETIKDCLR